MPAYYIPDQNVAAQWKLTATNSSAHKFINGQNPMASPSYANNPTKLGANNDVDELPFGGMGVAVWPPATLLLGIMGWQSSQHTDFNFRLWVIPSVLQLSNPQIGVNIPFRLWNTASIPETVTAITTVGSAVLSYDLIVGNVIRDKEFREVNLQIGPGESTIDAVTTFDTTTLTGDLRIIALVSDTFNLIPNIPVRETWEFKTDVMMNYRGSEQRIALRRFPRVKQQFSSDVLTFQERINQYSLMRRNISVPSLVPFFQYGTNLTADASSGSSRIYFNNTDSNVRAGEFLILINPVTSEIHLSEVTAVEIDGATMNSSLGFDVTTFWIVAPALNCLLNNGSGLNMSNVSGTLKVTADSFSEPALLRPNATRVIDTFDSIPWIDRRPLIDAQETFSFRKDVLDNQVGVRDLSSRDLHPKVSGDRKFLIQRIADPDEMDYWRSLFDTTRGAQKSFLLSTWFPDLTLSEPYTLGASSILVEEGYYSDLFSPYNTWNHIQMEFEGGLTTQHTVTSAVADLNGKCLISFTPAIPATVEYTTPLVISFLQRWKATDRVVFRHYANYSEVSFGVTSSDE